MFEVCPICHFDSVACVPGADRLYMYCTMCYHAWEEPLPDLPEEPPESEPELESEPDVVRAPSVGHLYASTKYMCYAPFDIPLPDLPEPEPESESESDVYIF